jgi:hypothetical protein
VMPRLNGRDGFATVDLTSKRTVSVETSSQVSAANTAIAEKVHKVTIVAALHRTGGSDGWGARGAISGVADISARPGTGGGRRGCCEIMFGVRGRQLNHLEPLVL